MNSLSAPAARVKPARRHKPAALSSYACLARPARKPRVKPARSIRLLALLDTGAGILQVTEGKKADRYFFSPLDGDWGSCYTVEKWADATPETPAGIVKRYEVCLHGEESVCCCTGFEMHGHCRHVEGLSALAAAGKLTPRQAAPAEPETADDTMARVLLSRERRTGCPHENVFQGEDGSGVICADCGHEFFPEADPNDAGAIDLAADYSDPF
jgi:hypothetical protein